MVVAQAAYVVLELSGAGYDDTLAGLKSKRDQEIADEYLSSDQSEFALAGILHAVKDEGHAADAQVVVMQALGAASTSVLSLAAITSANSSKAFKAAASRYPKQVESFQRQSREQLLKSQRSLEKQIEAHKKWIKDPESKAAAWDTFSPQHQENLIHHWKQDITRHTAYIEIIRGLLK